VDFHVNFIVVKIWIVVLGYDKSSDVQANAYLFPAEKNKKFHTMKRLQRYERILVMLASGYSQKKLQMLSVGALPI
jgi:hypothetical protein